MPEFIEICEQAARTGAVELMAWRDKFKATEKGPKDLVTEADLASQQAIQALIESVYPSHRFLGEEDGLPADLAEKLAGYCWIVDPLDGTTNYVHHMPAFAVSVALCLHGEPVVGVVYDPSLDECFAAERGAGASLNGVRIQCSTETELRQSLLALHSRRIAGSRSLCPRAVRVPGPPSLGLSGAESGLRRLWAVGRLLGNERQAVGRGGRLPVGRRIGG